MNKERESIKTVAIIGAGIAGAWLSSRLTREGFEVTVFDKARGAGGRTSTRRVDKVKIDHGAQFIEAVSPEFQSFLTELEDREVVKEWKDYKLLSYDSELKEVTGEIFPNKERLYIGMPGMNQIAKHLLFRANFVNKKKISFVTSEREIFSEDENLGKYDLVVSTAPPVQAGELLSKFPVAQYFSRIKMKTHFAAILLSDKDYDFGFDGMNIENSLLNWIGINSNKPGRVKKPLSIVLHTNFKFADATKSMSREQILETMLYELESITGFKDTSLKHLDLHRWLYARTFKPLGQDYIWDEEHNIAVCGDWLIGDNIEAAWTSADRLASALIESRKVLS